MSRIGKLRALIGLDEEKTLDVTMRNLRIEEFIKYTRRATEIFEEVYIAKQYIEPASGYGFPFRDYRLFSARPRCDAPDSHYDFGKNKDIALAECNADAKVQKMYISDNPGEKIKELESMLTARRVESVNNENDSYCKRRELYKLK